MSRACRSLIFRSASLILGISLALSVFGCKSTHAEADSLPPNKLKALSMGDQMINDGQDMKNDGMKLRADGKGGDDLIKQGEEKMAKGEKMKADAAMMKD